jgi:hypothetical protein
LAGLFIGYPFASIANSGAVRIISLGVVSDAIRRVPIINFRIIKLFLQGLTVYCIEMRHTYMGGLTETKNARK